MPGFSDYMEATMLDWLLTQGPFYVALFTSDPNDDNSGTECTGTPYARQSVTLSRSVSTVSNTGIVTFPESTDSWGTITHFAVFDAPTGGNQLYNGALAYSKVVGIGETLHFPAGSLTATAE